MIIMIMIVITIIIVIMIIIMIMIILIIMIMILILTIFTIPSVSGKGGTPNLPTNIVPANIARVKLSGKIPRKSLWAWEFHPLE